MAVSTTPLRLSTPSIGWPRGARVRFGAAKAGRLLYRRGRRARLAVCVVTCVGKHSAVVTKLTLYGAVLRGEHRLKRREIIALRLPSGWRVKARVQWRFGSRCGIAFLAPVADFARILCEGGAVKSSSKHNRAPAANALVAAPSREASPLSFAPGFADRLAGLAARAKAYAERARSWAATNDEGRDPRSG